MVDYEVLQAFVKEKHATHPFVGFDHVERVHNLCMRLAKDQAVDLEVLKVAAYLHDIAVPVLGPANHEEKAAEVAGDLVDNIGVPPEKQPLIFEVIRMHTRHSKPEPQMLEARILKDADGLDYIGAVGIMRGVMRSQQRKLYCGNVSAQGKAALDDLTDTVRGTFVTPAGQHLAAERIEFVKMFAKQLAAEISV